MKIRSTIIPPIDESSLVGANWQFIYGTSNIYDDKSNFELCTPILRTSYQFLKASVALSEGLESYNISSIESYNNIYIRKIGQDVMINVCPYPEDIKEPDFNVSFEEFLSAVFIHQLDTLLMVRNECSRLFENAHFLSYFPLAKLYGQFDRN